ncbi:MAG: hypothetical protein WBE80_10460 [Methylocella sp.]
MLRPRRLGCSGARRGVRAATCGVKSGARAATCDVSIGVPVTTSPGAAAAFARAGADQFALGKPAKHGQHQAPVRGRRVGPCVME